MPFLYQEFFMYKIGKTKIYIHQINGFKKIPRLNKFKEGNLVADYKYNIIILIKINKFSILIVLQKKCELVKYNIIQKN